MTSLRTVPELHTSGAAILVSCDGTHAAEIARIMRITNVILSLTTVASIATFAGCSKKSKATDVATPAPTKPAATAKATPAKVGDASLTVDDPSGTAPPAGPIFFEFDSSVLTAESRDLLSTFATWAVTNKPKLTIEGHTDEQGTTEYNLALGDRRARAVADYLKAQGVDDKLVTTITYGEERPAQQGSTEDAHSANRRGEVKTN
jgi:peptidoglycan-associated lipoprotein